MKFSYRFEKKIEPKWGPYFQEVWGKERDGGTYPIETAEKLNKYGRLVQSSGKACKSIMEVSEDSGPQSQKQDREH